jgi:hypothetical protein
MTTGAAVVAAMIQAVKASGVLVRVEPDAFSAILRKSQSPLVVRARSGLFSNGYQYLTSYKGLAFWTKSREGIQLPVNAEIVEAGKIWVPT